MEEDTCRREEVIDDTKLWEEIKRIVVGNAVALSRDCSLQTCDRARFPNGWRLLVSTEKVSTSTF